MLINQLIHFYAIALHSTLGNKDKCASVRQKQHVVMQHVICCLEDQGSPTISCTMSEVATDKFVLSQTQTTFLSLKYITTTVHWNSPTNT